MPGHSPLPPPAPIAEWPGLAPRILPEEILASPTPLVLRGLIADWPLVRAGLRSPRDAADELRRFYRGAPVKTFLGAPEDGGRFFYNADLSGFNFRNSAEPLDRVLDALLQQLEAQAPPAIYVGATAVDHWLPGFRAENDVDLGAREALASAWIGNRSRVSAHQDVPDNLACVAVGRRRFTLFPPDELANLYIGPLDYTPAGQAISLVDLHAPDLERYPRFALAWQRAQVAELGPGDALFIPSLWWHHIEALEAFNVLVNYWWRQSPAWLDSPLSALMLAMLSLRDLPQAQRAAWQEIFRHYVFEPDAQTAAHIPQAAQRVLAPLDEAMARELRAQLLQRLKR